MHARKNAKYAKVQIYLCNATQNTKTPLYSQVNTADVEKYQYLLVHEIATYMQFSVKQLLFVRYVINKKQLRFPEW